MSRLAFIDEVATAQAAAAAAASEPPDEEVEYIFVSLEGVAGAQEDLARGGELIVEGLLSGEPRGTVGGITYRGAFDEDLGSTLFFDRAALKRIADSQSSEVSTLTLAAEQEEPLVCVTSKRLRVR